MTIDQEISPEKPYERMTGPVHAYFGLSHSTHDVRPRVLMQSMPVEWQERYVRCVREFDAAFAAEPVPEYRVQAGEWGLLNDDDDATRRAGWLIVHGEEDTRYYSPEGFEVTADEADGHYIFSPGRDEYADYRHTYIDPVEDALHRSTADLERNITDSHSDNLIVSYDVVLTPNIARGWGNLGPFVLAASDSEQPDVEDLAPQVTERITAELGVPVDHVEVEIGDKGEGMVRIDGTDAYKLRIDTR